MNKFQRAYQELFGSFGTTPKFPTSETPLTLQRIIEDNWYVKVQPINDSGINASSTVIVMTRATAFNVIVRDSYYYFWNNGGAGFAQVINNARLVLRRIGDTGFSATRDIVVSFADYSPDVNVIDGATYQSPMQLGEGFFSNPNFYLAANPIYVPKGYELIFVFNLIELTQNASLQIRFMEQKLDSIPEYNY